MSIKKTSLIVKLFSIIMLLAFATHHGLDIQQMDVKITFLNG